MIEALVYVLMTVIVTPSAILHRAQVFKTMHECEAQLENALKGLPYQSAAFCAPIPTGKEV